MSVEGYRGEEKGENGEHNGKKKNGQERQKSSEERGWEELEGKRDFHVLSTALQAFATSPKEVFRKLFHSRLEAVYTQVTRTGSYVPTGTTQYM